MKTLICTTYLLCFALLLPGTSSARTVQGVTFADSVKAGSAALTLHNAALLHAGKALRGTARLRGVQAPHEFLLPPAAPGVRGLRTPTPWWGRVPVMP